ncbi:MAG TPA: ABC transporter permease [Stellaceae bacterium]|jgi:sulfonate transport system permease protein|nr:ABC transporter permease [Stellaceae bacterium]
MSIDALFSPAVRRGLVAPALFIAAWFALSHSGWVDSRLLVAPERAVAVAFDDPNGRLLWPALAVSIGRMLAGFAIGASLGIVFGFVMGLSPVGERLFGLSFNAVRQITLFAWIPLLTAWFGNGEAAKLVFIALSAFFPMALNTLQGLRDLSPQYRELAEVLRLSRRTRLLRVLLPASLPAIAVGIELSLIGAWIGTVGAEYAMGFGRGLGIYLAEGREQFRMDIVIVGALTLAIIGYALNRIFTFGLRRLMSWRGIHQ